MKLSELTDNSTQNAPKMKLSDIIKNKAMASNRVNPDMQGGSNAPAVKKANQLVKDLTSQNEALDVLPSVAKGLQNASWPVSQAYPKDAREYKPTTGGGKAIADIGWVANPILQKGFDLAGKGIVAGGKAIGKFIPETIKRGAADYLTNNVAPKVHQLYQDAVAKFTPEIQKFARDKNIPESAIRTIKTHGPQAIEHTKDSLGNYSTDAISQKINNGFSEKRSFANKAYQQAMDNSPEGKQINIRPAIESAGRKLKRLGLINDKGKLTELGKSEIARDSVYGKLADFYNSADSISGVKGLKQAGYKPIDFPNVGKALQHTTQDGKDIYVDGGSKLKKLIQADQKTLVNKYQYTFLRDKLNSLYKNKSSDIDVGQVVNQFYSDGERAGIKGLQEARRLQRESFQAEENLQKGGMFGERGANKLDKYHTFTDAEKKHLNDVEKYINVPFTKDLEKVSAGKYLDKIQDGKSLKDFQSLLNQAVDKKWTVSKQKELESMVGKQNSYKIIREVLSHRRAMTTKKVAKIVGGGAAGALGAGAVYGAGKEMLGQ